MSRAGCVIHRVLKWYDEQYGVRFHGGWWTAWLVGWSMAEGGEYQRIKWYLQVDSFRLSSLVVCFYRIPAK